MHQREGESFPIVLPSARSKLLRKRGLSSWPLPAELPYELVFEKHVLGVRFLLDTEANDPSLATVSTRSRVSAIRHERQLTGLQKLKNQRPAQGVVSIPFDRKFACYQVVVDEATTAQLGGDLAAARQEGIWPFQEYLYLFNLIVALEWKPSARYLTRLETAFRRASSFMFDVSDGYMAFGQVIIGGPELLDGADIQIAASNRLLPRSWVNALNEERKYMPIRMGRGVWQKNSRVLVNWDEPEGYRTLVHELGHYALSLRDQYLDTIVVSDQRATATSSTRLLASGQIRLVVPTISVSDESIMSSLEGSSELTLQEPSSLVPTRTREWDALKAQYHRIQLNHQSLDGPTVQPLPLPFVCDAADLHVGDAVDPLLKDLPKGIQLDHCWIYLLKNGAAVTDDSVAFSDPQQLIAQGSFDARAVYQGFPLFDAAAGDTVILLGEDTEYHPLVLWSRVTEIRPDPIQPTSGQMICRMSQWQNATPQNFPYLDVVPLPLAVPSSGEVALVSPIKVNVQHTSEVSTQEQHLWIFPFGGDAPTVHGGTGNEWSSGVVQPSSLDGHVLLEIEPGCFTISSYSQSGGPASGIPSGPPPISAGSSEGNVMLFFEDREPSRDFSTTRIITTRHVGITSSFEQDGEPRGYAFSIASNEELSEQLSPTLVMNFDRDTDLSQGELTIFRYEGRDTDWQIVPSFIPAGEAFVAAPLNHETARNLLVFATSSQPRVVRFRLGWQPWKQLPSL